MGRRPWTTFEQAKFLHDNVGQYENAQAAKKTKRWLEAVCERFLEQFPISPEIPKDDAEILKGLTAKVSVSFVIVHCPWLIASVHRLLSQRVCEWFPNHSGPRSARNRANARVTTSIIHSILTGSKRRRTRKLLRYQAYSRFKWPELRFRIRAEWELEKRNLAPGTKLPGAYLNFMRRRLEVLLEAESDEVKQKVEELCNNPAQNDIDDDGTLHPHEHELPQSEREAIQRSREIQQYVVNYSLY